MNPLSRATYDVSRPIPELASVIRATLPFRLPIMTPPVFISSIKKGCDCNQMFCKAYLMLVRQSFFLLLSQVISIHLLNFLSIQ